MIQIRSKSVSGANIDYHLYEEGEGNFVEPFYVYGEKAMTEASSKVPYLHEQIKAMYFIQETCWPLDIIYAEGYCKARCMPTLHMCLSWGHGDGAKHPLEP